MTGTNFQSPPRRDPQDGPKPPRNLVFILSDEHNRDVLGCYGHPFVQTPNLDALAGSGVRFDAACCNSPICVPSRASLATGRHVHALGNWDNAFPYTGAPRSWHHVLRDAGVDVASIGKLHFRGGDDYGFTEELIPLHVLNGKGDLKGLFRRDPLPKKGTRALSEQAGPGRSSYSDYDARIAQTASDWLARRAENAEAPGFALFVSFVMPHFPLIAPEDCYALYEDHDLDTLQHGLTAPVDPHPALDHMRRISDYDAHFTPATRARALRAYYGMVTRLDQLIGEVLRSLEETGLSETTSVIYSSDHGDNLGSHGLWGKSVMYESAVAVPLILRDPRLDPGSAVDVPVSLADIAPTAADICGVEEHDPDWSGTSLVEIARTPPRDRSVFAEYHATSSNTGMFMVRQGQWKYICYPGFEPQLFDLATDPQERRNLAGDAACREILQRLDAELRTYCDPEEVNTRAFADQAAMIEANGGRETIAASADIPFTPAPS